VWICTANQILSHKLEKEDYDGWDMWKECLKKVFKNIPEGKKSVEKPRKRRLDDVENDTKEMSVKSLVKNS
jgi:RNA-splicing ligase RtcB